MLTYIAINTICELNVSTHTYDVVLDIYNSYTQFLRFLLIKLLINCSAGPALVMMGRQDRAAMAYRCGVDLDEANLSTRSAACNSVLHTQRRVLKARTQRRNYTELN